MEANRGYKVSPERDTRFKPGHAGPGRPKGSQNAIPAKIRALCLKAAPEIIEELKRLATDPNPSVRLAACKELLDRGIGKAAQPVVGESGEGPVRVEYIFSWFKSETETETTGPIYRERDGKVEVDPTWVN